MDEPADKNREGEHREGDATRGSLRERVAGFFARVAPLVRPWLEQSALNVKVWIPALRSKAMKSGQVKYRARESRTGLTWKIVLPSVCWHCGATEGLSRRDFNFSRRAFDGPLPIACGTFGLGAIFWIGWLLVSWHTGFIIGCLLMLLGAALLWLKSWRERVKLTLWTCAAHADELVTPGVVSHEEDLYLFLPSQELAEKARAEVIAARRREGRYTSQIADERPPDEGRRGAADAGPPLTSPDEPPLPTRLPGTRSELPPLKLAGEEDEPPRP